MYKFLLTLLVTLPAFAHDHSEEKPTFPGLISSEVFNLGNDMEMHVERRNSCNQDHVSRRCDFSCYHHHARFDKRLNGDPRIGVFGQVGIQNGIGNLIRHLVRVTLGHGFRCEK